MKGRNKTDHFSEYMLTTENIDAANSATGYTATAALALVAVTGAFVIVSKKKK